MREPVPTGIPVEWTEDHGLPVAWADVDGPFAAGLTFRVGWADESLPQRGLTHLVEHLALTRGGGERTYECNGFTTATLTGFVMNGTVEQAVEFLEQVCAGLVDLPLDRLDHEVQVLRAEEHAHPAGLTGTLLERRFGATGFGTIAYRQLGLNNIRPETVAAWRDRWFTAGNAVAWISTRPPERLRLDLPPGPRHALRDATALSTPLPALVVQESTALVISMIGPRTPETILATSVLDHHLQRTLRHQLGLSYAAGARYEPLDATSAHVLLTADHVPGRAPETGEAMVAALRQIAEGGPAAGDLERAQADLRSRLALPDGRALGMAELDRTSKGRLFGRTEPSRDELVQQLDAITAEQVAAAVSQLAWTAIMLAPPGVGPHAIQLHPYPESSRDVIAGRTYGRRLTAPNGAPAGARLIVGDDGISMVDIAGRAWTVRFARCAALLWWSDGRRQLVGEDGFSVTVLTSEWELSDSIVRAIDSAVPGDRFVSMSPLGKAGELTCQVCGRAPAIQLHLRCVTGMILMYSIRTERHLLCRDCGIARFRTVSGESMVGGWWGLIAYFANVIVLAENANQRRRLAALPSPYGEPSAQPLRASRPLWARPATFVAAIALGIPLALIGTAIVNALAGG